jgi:hypothetical protein
VTRLVRKVKEKINETRKYIYAELWHSHFDIGGGLRILF